MVHSQRGGWRVYSRVTEGTAKERRERGPTGEAGQGQQAGEAPRDIGRGQESLEGGAQGRHLGVGGTPGSGGRQGPAGRGCRRRCRTRGCWGQAGARGFWMEGMSPVLSHPQQLPVQMGGRDRCFSRRKGSRCWPLSLQCFLDW